MSSQVALVRPDTKGLEVGIEALRKRANEIVVKDSETYAENAKFLVEIRNFKKRVGFVTDPYIAFAKEALDKAKDEKNKYIQPADEIEEIVSAKGEAWVKSEREAAAAEERRINEQRRRAAEEVALQERKLAEARAEEDRKARQKEIDVAAKAGELKKREADKLRKEADEQAEKDKQAAAARQQEASTVDNSVKVQPSIPKVSGVRRRVNFCFSVVDKEKLPERFKMADEKAIGEVVRSSKNSKLSETLIPGIRCWEEDSI
jgi:septal ring factor EnvC (AmiA/AmiB activator)